MLNRVNIVKTYDEQVVKLNQETTNLHNWYLVYSHT